MMSIAKEKSLKTSTQRRAKARAVPPFSPKGAHPVSTDKVAEQFCGEMIQNLESAAPRKEMPSSELSLSAA